MGFVLMRREGKGGGERQIGSSHKRERKVGK